MKELYVSKTREGVGEDLESKSRIVKLLLIQFVVFLCVCHMC